MIHATKNQLSIVTNPHQGAAKKVLCVCTAGLLRSPTMANVLHQELGYNTRACGSAMGFALIPISQALIAWAEEIVFVDSDCEDFLNHRHWEEIEEWAVDIVRLDIPDDYDYDDPELKQIILSAYVANGGEK